MLLSGLSIFFGIYFSRYFLKWNEKRPGKIIDDPILVQLPNFNCSDYICFLEVFTGAHSCIAIFNENGFSYVEILCFKFAIITLFKMLTLYLLPMQPPHDFIPLSDLVLDTLMDTTHTPMSKDLFFSGHVSFMALCTLNMITRTGQLLGLCGTIAMALMLMINRIHYTIDVVIAPFVVFTIDHCINYYLEELLFFNSLFDIQLMGIFQYCFYF